MRRLPPSVVVLVGLSLAFACQRGSTTSAEAPAGATNVVESTGGERSEVAPAEPPLVDDRPAPTDAPRERPRLGEFAAAMLAAHNRVRAEARPTPATPIPPLRWDAELASLAQAWADSCPTGHRPDNDHGENLFWSGGQAPAPEVSVQSWADEARNYDYETTVCSRGGRSNWAFCGHYTQVVWRETQRVGCGIRTDCPGSFDTVIVCNYDPPGNVNATARRIPRPF